MRIPTPAQLAANRANAQLSTGPRTEDGKAASSLNHYKFGFTGALFQIMPWENMEDYLQLRAGLQAEHQPSTPTETLLFDSMVKHHWLAQRAILLQSLALNVDYPAVDNEKQLALFLRYQTTHERAFFKCLKELQALKKSVPRAAATEPRASARGSHDIGFESQSEPQGSTRAAEPQASAGASHDIGFESQSEPSIPAANLDRHHRSQKPDPGFINKNAA